MGLFGAAPAAAPSFATPAPKPAAGLFGGGGGGFALGGAAGTTTPAGTPGPALSFGAPAAAAPATTGFSGFGAPAPAASTTPAAAPPATNLFGGGAGGGLFGKRDAEAASDGGGKKLAFSGFGGAPPATTLAAAPALGATTAAPSLFGAPPAATSAPSLFGGLSAPSTAAPAVPASTAPSLFGATPATAAPAAPTSLFGASAAPAATASLFGAPAPAKPLFGAAPSPAASTASSTTTFSTTTPSLFGAKPAAAPAQCEHGSHFRRRTLLISFRSYLRPTLLRRPFHPFHRVLRAYLRRQACYDHGSRARQARCAGSDDDGGAWSDGTGSFVAEGEDARGDCQQLEWGVGREDEGLYGYRWGGEGVGPRAEGERREGLFVRLCAGGEAADGVVLKISELYTSVLPLSPLQGQISSSLDYVESQQKDLAAILDSYEAQIGDLVDQSSTSAGWRGNSGQAEKEREKACVPFLSTPIARSLTFSRRRYTLATSLSNSLDTTSTSLTSLIQTLNSLSPSLRPSTTASAPEDPLTQIAAILNAHLGSLKWIEGTTDNLRKNVNELEGRVGEVGSRMSARAMAPGRGAGLGASSPARS